MNTKLIIRMDDRNRDILVKRSAYGFVSSFLILFIVAIFFGKNYGTYFLCTVIPIYSLYYLLMYRIVCKNYKDEVKRISAFGLIARGTFVGSIYYASMFILATLLLVIGAALLPT